MSAGCRCPLVEVVERDHTGLWVLGVQVLPVCQLGQLDPAPVLGIHHLGELPNHPDSRSREATAANGGPSIDRSALPEADHDGPDRTASV